MSEEYKRFVFILWKARNHTDFDHHMASLHNALRGILSARGMNEARHKIISKHQDDIDHNEYDRITIYYGLGCHSTTPIVSVVTCLWRMNTYGY